MIDLLLDTMHNPSNWMTDRCNDSCAKCKKINLVHSMKCFAINVFPRAVPRSECDSMITVIQSMMMHV